MPLISVITAAHSGRQKYLREAAVTVLEQKLPENWELEWLVQEDFDKPQMEDLVREISERDARVHYAASRTTLGPGSTLIQEDGDDPALEDIVGDFALGGKRVRYGANGTALGPGGTRTLALWRARGELIRTLDSDDLLLPGALATQINLFTTYPDIQWSVTQPNELLPDRSQVPYHSTLAFGAVPPGSLNRNMAKYGRCPVHCAGLMIRADVARAFGGWMGLPVGEDVGLLAAISEIFAGWHDPAVTWLYRRHHAQTTGTVLRPFWRTLGETAGAQRSAAISRLGLTAVSASNCATGSYLASDVRE